MSITDARTQAYYQLFKSSQSGGFLPVYQGISRYQSGQGFGDFFRGLFRRIIPVGLNAAKTFISSLGSSSEAGSTMKEALKSAIRPAATAALQTGAEQLGKFQQARETKAAQKQQDKELKRLAALDQGPAAGIPATATESEFRKPSAVASSIEQSGTGRRRKRKRVYKHKKRSHKSKRFAYNF